jgi:hypothetical protein
MKRYFLLLIVINFSIKLLCAQSFGDKPSLSFGVQEATHGADLSTGVLNISVPLDNTVVPLALSFSAGGIKVNEISGAYGLGWNLSAEAFIVREVRGLPDDKEEGYSGKNNRGLAVNSTLNFDNANKFFFQALWDTEPDIFRYQFLGYSGLFILDPNRNAVKLTHDNVKIMVNYSDGSGFTSFTATDPDGNTYNFNIVEEITNQVDFDTPFTYKYKWHLSAVNFYNSSKTINCGYSGYGTITTQTTHQSGAPASGSSGSLTVLTKNIKNSWAPLYLSSISSGRFFVTFQYESRTDIINARRLKYVFVGENEKIVSRYEFNYEYFSNEGTNRLKLKSIYKVNPELPTDKLLVSLFSYYGENHGEKILPAYNSKKQDHWGFFNNNSLSSLFVYDGANRDPSIDETKACTLKKVHFPSGKTEEYEYELNSYFDGSSNINIGGLRIKSITTKNTTSTIYTKSYNYNISDNSTGHIYNLPQYSRYRTWYEGGLNNLDGNIYNINSYRSLVDINGRHIIYRKVTTTMLDNSQVESYFKTFNDQFAVFPYFPARYKIKIDKKNSQLTGHTTALTPDNNTPFGNYSYFGILAGLPESTIYLDSEGRKLKEEQYSYEYFNGLTTNYGVASLLHSFYVSSDASVWYAEYYIGKYQIKPYYFKLQTKIVKDYTDQTAHNLTTQSNYQYNTTNFLVSREESYMVGSNNDHLITQTNYLRTAPGSVANVSEHNLMNAVTSVSYSRDYKYLGSNQNIYGNNGSGKVELHESKVLQPTGVIKEHQSYTYQNGVLMKSTNVLSGEKASFIYDDKKLYPIAEASNTDDSNIAYSGFERNETGNWYYPFKHYSEDCEIDRDQCYSYCHYSDPLCEDHCYDQYIQCMDDVSTSNESRAGNYSFILAKGNLSKSGLSAGKYILSFWKKNGSPIISGVTSNVLISTYSANGWTLEEREVQLSASPYTITLSGNCLLDELKLHPVNALMTSKSIGAYGTVFESDINNISAFTEYDSFGRPTVIRNNRKEIVNSFKYNIGHYLFSNFESTSIKGEGETNKKVDIISNASWTATPNHSWITLWPSSGSKNGNINCSFTANAGSTSRTGTVTLSNGSTSQVVSFVQAPGPYINCPTYLSYSPGNQTKSFTVTSNIAWSITNIRYVQGGTGWLYFGQTNGTGTQTFNITVYGTPGGNTWVAEFDVVGSGVTRTVTVLFYGY